MGSPQPKAKPSFRARAKRAAAATDSGWWKVGVGGGMLALVVVLILFGVWYAAENPLEQTVVAGGACGVPDPDQLLVTTASGIIHGFPATIANATDSGSTQGVLRHFFGFPYGQPPTGTNRFKRSNWISYYQPNGTWFAHEHGPPCPQSGPLLNGSDEDCLRLSIWAPYVCDAKEPLKTVVFAVSGDWLQNEDVRENEELWQALALKGDLIVAVPNHRVGFLGFFSGAQEDAPGNVGIHDVNLSLTWVERNAKAFHGDPHSIIPVGYGSGGFVLALNLLTRHSVTHKRFILHGLSPLSLMPEYDDQTSFVQRVGGATRCASDTIQRLTNCLRGKDFKEVVSSAESLGPLVFVPARDRPPLMAEYFIEPLHNMFRDLSGVQIVCGYSRKEGHALYDKYVLPTLSKNGSGISMPDVYRKLLRFFTGENKDPFPALKYLNATGLPGFREVLMHAAMNCPMIELAKEASINNAVVYHYASAGEGLPLVLDDIIRFVKTGEVRQPWTPFGVKESTLVIDGSSREEKVNWDRDLCSAVRNMLQ